MTSLAAFLSLPKSSSNFGNRVSNELSPIHKIPRLDTDADISRSRSASRLVHSANESTGITTIKIIGDDGTSHADPSYEFTHPIQCALSRPSTSRQSPSVTCGSSYLNMMAESDSATRKSSTPAEPLWPLAMVLTFTGLSMIPSTSLPMN